jgi:hypothetical protein
VYLALDAVLHGASSSQLSNLVSALGNAGTAAAAVVAAGGNAVADPGAANWAEVQARGADTWGAARQGPLERVSTAQVRHGQQETDASSWAVGGLGFGAFLELQHCRGFAGLGCVSLRRLVEPCFSKLC